MARRGGSIVVICATLALLPDVAPRASAHDSLAPRDGSYHRWLPAGRWVSKHWIPYDEARLRELLAVDTPTIYGWLEDDHRTLAHLARRRGVHPRGLAARLVEPRRSEL